MATSPRHDPDQSHQGWLTAAACHSIPATANQEVALPRRLRQLPRRQQLDLASIAAAAIASSAIMLVPFMTAPVDRTPIPASMLAIQFAAAPTVSIAATFSAVARPARATRPTRVRTVAASPLAARPLARGELMAPGSRPIARTASNSEPGRLTRVLFGSGRHKVRPFPVPAADEN